MYHVHVIVSGDVMLRVGDNFPQFNLTAHVNLPLDKLTIDNAFTSINNKTYQGKWLVIFFYPKDFTFICPTEIVAFSDMYEQFAERNAQILGCSVDSEFVHFAWRKYHKPLNNIKFPLLADVKRELCSALDILSADGVAERALFLVDPDGVIKFAMMTDPSVGRNPVEVLRVLDALQTGELCPCSWTPGAPTLDLSKADI